MRGRRTLAAVATTALVVGGGAVSAAAATAPPELPGKMSAAAEPEVEDVGILVSDAPTVIRLGAASMTLPITVATGQPMDYLEAGVVSPDDALVGYGFAEAPVAGRPNVFKPQVEVLADELTSWGEHAWIFYGDRDSDDVVATGVALTEIKAHSLLGLSASRNGSGVTVRGSARAYHSVQDRYVPWSGRPVSVQRWTGSAWVQVAGATTDARGNFSRNLQVPAGSQLRLVVRDVETIWGAVSGTSTV